MAIKDLTARLSQIKRYLTSALRGRLLLYTLVLILLLGGILTGANMLFGRLASVEQQTGESLTLRLSVYQQNIVRHFDEVAARGIKLSQQISTDLEAWLQAEEIGFAELSGDPDTIAKLQEALYDPLVNALTLTDASGAWYLFDVTANPLLPEAEHSKAGTYIRIANINVSRPIDPKLVLYRGYTIARRHHRQELHNMWALEFDTKLFPDYDLLVEKANPDLNSCFLFTDSVQLPGTWENIVLLCVPIMGKDGAYYGLCGFEISQLYFKLHHAQDGSTGRIMGLLTRYDNQEINTGSGLQSGDRTGYFVSLDGKFTTQPGTHFNTYRLANDLAFIGLEHSVRLSPLEDAHQIAVLIPKADYDQVHRLNFRENIIIALLLISTAIFGSSFMSKMYVKPIITGLQRLKNEQVATGSVMIQEIEDLLDFLAVQDQKREAERLELEKQLKALNRQDKDPESLVPSRAAYDLFLENLTTLTNAEREVFILYMEGHRAKDMPDILCRSMNTIKTHNKRIYDKLGVSSRYELLTYMEIMKQEGIELEQP